MASHILTLHVLRESFVTVKVFYCFRHTAVGVNRFEMSDILDLQVLPTKGHTHHYYLSLNGPLFCQNQYEGQRTLMYLNQHDRTVNVPELA